MVGEGDFAGLRFRTAVTFENRCNGSALQPAFCRMIFLSNMQPKPMNRCNWPNYGHQ